MRDAVLEASERLLRAIASRDEAALEELLAADFQHLDAAGARLDRAAFVAGITGAPYEIRSIGFERIDVVAVDAAAVATGVQVAEVVLADGTPVTSRGSFTDVFTRVGGRWVIRLACSTEL